MNDEDDIWEKIITYCFYGLIVIILVLVLSGCTSVVEVEQCEEINRTMLAGNIE